MKKSESEKKKKEKEKVIVRKKEGKSKVMCNFHNIPLIIIVGYVVCDSFLLNELGDPLHLP